MTTPLWAGVVVLAAALALRADEPPAWVGPMRQVHARFTGKPGTLALFGDSITYSRAFWAPLAYAPKNLSEPVANSLAVVKGHMLEECWARWRGPAYGNESGRTIAWAEQNVETWLKKLNPEVAVLMFGTNDLGGLGPQEFDRRTRAVVRKCLDNGTVVILTTIPPRAGAERQAAAFADVQRTVAADLGLPLVDFHAEILRRRPDDWNGALPQFRAEAVPDGYQVPTLIAADGVHPSNPARYQDYSAEALRNNGYQLRTVLTLHVYADIIRYVLTAKKP